MGINPKHFRRINLNEPSSRPGVEGNRYVEVPGARHLGDTNTGKVVPPYYDDSPMHQFSDDTQARDAQSIVNG